MANLKGEKKKQPGLPPSKKGRKKKSQYKISTHSMERIGSSIQGRGGHKKKKQTGKPSVAPILQNSKRVDSLRKQGRNPDTVTVGKSFMGQRKMRKKFFLKGGGTAMASMGRRT